MVLLRSGMKPYKIVQNVSYMPPRLKKIVLRQRSGFHPPIRKHAYLKQKHWINPFKKLLHIMIAKKIALNKKNFFAHCASGTDIPHARKQREQQTVESSFTSSSETLYQRPSRGCFEAVKGSLSNV